MIWVESESTEEAPSSLAARWLRLNYQAFPTRKAFPFWLDKMINLELHGICGFPAFLRLEGGLSLQLSTTEIQKDTLECREKWVLYKEFIHYSWQKNSCYPQKYIITWDTILGVLEKAQIMKLFYENTEISPFKKKNQWTNSYKKLSYFLLLLITWLYQWLTFILSSRLEIGIQTKHSTN